MSSPVTLQCGHSVCLKCFRQLVSASPAPKCPVCRSGLPDGLSVNVCMNELTRKLAMKCLSAECGWSGGYGEAEAHGAHCPKAVINCANAGCTVSAKREYMANHEDTCLKKAMPCLKCHKTVVRERTQEHEESGCEFSEVECPLACGERFPRYVLDQSDFLGAWCYCNLANPNVRFIDSIRSSTLRCYVHVHLASCKQSMKKCVIKGCKAVKRLREGESHDRDRDHA